mgnify:CR=1 FL=1
MSKVSQHSFIHSLYKSRGVLLDILKRRGYNVEEYENISFSEISKMEKNKQLDMVVETDTNKKIYVKYHLSTKIRPNQVYEITDDLFNLEEVLDLEDELIIITKDKPNDTLIKLMRSLYVTDNIFFNIFCINELLYNVLDHQMVPPHRIISEDEKKELFKNYNITDESQLPDINRFDPVARVLGCRPGNIVEIVRPSKTSISAKYYRLCF